MRACWCGSDDFGDFNADYGICSNCGTLVSQNSLSDAQLQVHDDEVDFYGKQYWLAHQAGDLGFPDIHARARHDLTERNLHWLATLLKYRPPPAATIELGCAHGSFVAMMQQAGYRSRGVEMSRWVVEFGKRTFGVPIDVGPVEGLDIEAGSLDVVALMDVLEHLPDPVGTMRHCLRLLKPDGFLLIQTPCFQTGMRYEALRATHSPFLEQLKFDEHLYLFTRDSVRRLFAELGAAHVAFEPAIFEQYDMFFAVGRLPLQACSEQRIREALAATPAGHMVGALLDLRARELSLLDRFTQADADRSARGTQIETLTARLQQVEASHASRANQIATLTSLLQASETDRSARARQIDLLDQQLRASERDRAERGEQIDVLTRLLRESEADRAARAQQIGALEQLLHEAEADRASRGEQISTLTDLLKDAEADRTARGEQIALLNHLLEESEIDRAARAEQITTLDGLARRYEADCRARGEQIEKLTSMVQEAQAHRG